jgi:hypothetical protein
VIQESLESRIHDPDEPEKVLKVIGGPLDDAFDGFRYGVYSYQYPSSKPLQVRINETSARELSKRTEMAPTMAFIKHQKMLAEEPEAMRSCLQVAATRAAGGDSSYYEPQTADRNGYHGPAITTRGISTQQMQVVWADITLHTTRSIALHKEPDVAMTHWGITEDVLGLRKVRVAFNAKPLYFLGRRCVMNKRRNPFRSWQVSGARTKNMDKSR